MPRILKQAGAVLFIALVIFVLLTALTRAQMATGGQFSLEKSVVAGGGREKQSLSASENGTSGQAIAGHRSTGGQYSLRSGFWTPEFELAPTAGNSSVTGRVVTADGRGISNARVRLISSTGETWLAVTGSFGYFKFTEVPTGENYVLSVQAKRFTFAEPAYMVQVTDDVVGIVFTAN